MSVRVVTDRRTGFHRVLDDRSGAVEEANRFLRALQLRGLSPHTIRAYAYDLLAIYRWMNRASKRVAKLRESELVGFIAQQRQSGIGAQSINRRLTVCRLFYRFVTDTEMDRGLGLSTASGYYRGPGRDKNLGLYNLPRSKHLRLQVKVPHTVVEPLTVEQVKTLLGTIKRYRDLCIVHLMLLCGLRSREVLALRLTDLCFEDARLRICGKGNKQRVLPLPKVLLELVGDYLRLERPAKCTSKQLFVVLSGQRRGRAMTPSGLRSLFRYRRQLTPEIKNANAHRFRHTFGADMARAGVRLPVLQKMMGHSNSYSTLQYINLSMADIAQEYHRAMKQIGQRYRKADRSKV